MCVARRSNQDLLTVIVVRPTILYTSRLSSPLLLTTTLPYLNSSICASIPAPLHPLTSTLLRPHPRHLSTPSHFYTTSKTRHLVIPFPHKDDPICTCFSPRLHLRGLERFALLVKQTHSYALSPRNCRPVCSKGKDVECATVLPSRRGVSTEDEDVVPKYEATLGCYVKERCECAQVKSHKGWA